MGKGGNGVLGDESAGDSEEARFGRAPLEEDQAHHHPQGQRKEASPPRLAGLCHKHLSLLRVYHDLLGLYFLNFHFFFF